jgi:putative transposase
MHKNIGVWRPKRLTREQMEERRLAAGEQFAGGRKDYSEIGRELGVSRNSVSDWAAVYGEKGAEGLRRSQGGGRPRRLSAEGGRQLLEELAKGATAHGYVENRWTAGRVAEVLERTQGIHYDPDHMGVVLRRLGWSPQKAQRVAAERDEEAILAWLGQTLPEEVKKGSRRKPSSSS